MKSYILRIVAAAAVTGVIVGAACAGSGKGSRSPEACMTTCEAECPGKADGMDSDKYVNCLSDCEKKCGVSSGGEAP